MSEAVEQKANLKKHKASGLEDRAPLLVLFLSLFLTGVSIWAAYQNVKERERIRFERSIDEVEENLGDRINTYLGLLWATVGVFQANELNVTEAQFRRFRLAADWGGRNDGLAGLTFIQKVAPENRSAFEAKYRERYPEFAIHPEMEGESDSLYAATLFEPMTPAKQKALGYNPFSDQIRRRAMELTAATGRASVTQKVNLQSDLLDNRESPAILLYAPVYHPGAELLTREEREHLIYGFVSAGFYLKDLLEHLQKGASQDQIGFQIVSGQGDTPEDVLAQTGEPASFESALSHSRKVDVAGGVWTIHYWTLPNFHQSSPNYQVPIVAVMGTLLSLTLFSLAIVQARARKSRELALHHETQRAMDLEEQDKTKTRFFSNLNHELRTPLNGILGMSDLLYDTDLNARQKDYLSSIGSCAKALLDLISDVLDLSKINAGKMELRLAPVNLKEIFEQAIQVVRGPAQGKGVDLFLEWDAELPIWIEADGVRFRQILINLLGNAVKFTEEGKVVLRAKLIHGAEEQEVLSFEVEDTGIGIAESDVRMLFKPFSQLANDSATPEQKGTGLGLHLCKELLDLMSGQISVESEQGVGTLFRCTLPIASLDSNPYETQSIPNAAELLNNCLRILVVDDNPINRRVLSLQLEKLGQKTTVAVGGADAVKKVEQEAFDLVLMDCQMPEVDGLEATRLIRRKFPSYPFVVALTAFAEETQKQVCLDAGMDDFLTKPVDASRLSNLIKKYGALVERDE